MLSKWDWCVSRSWELRLFLFFFVGSKVEPPSTNGLVFPSFTSTSTTGTAATTTRRRRRRTEKKVARNQTTRENHVLKGSMRSIDSPDATAKTNEEKNTRSSRSYKIGTLLHSRGSNPTKKKNFSAPPRSGFGRLERRPRTDEGPAPSGRCRRDADDAGWKGRGYGRGGASSPRSTLRIFRVFFSVHLLNFLEFHGFASLDVVVLTETIGFSLQSSLPHRILVNSTGFSRMTRRSSSYNKKTQLSINEMDPLNKSGSV